MLDLEILFKERIDHEFPGSGEFDPKKEYAYDEVDHERMTANTHRLQTGRIVNLIRRMADRGATEEELNRALCHAFVVIDAMKHHLDWRKSLEDFGIRDLERKYPRT